MHTCPPLQAATDEAAARANTTTVSNATFSLGGADRAPTNGPGGSNPDYVTPNFDYAADGTGDASTTSTAAAAALGHGELAPAAGTLHAGIPSTFQAAIASPEYITAALNFDAGAPTAVMTNAGTNTTYEQRPATGGLQRQVALYVTECGKMSNACGCFLDHDFGGLFSFVYTDAPPRTPHRACL